MDPTTEPRTDIIVAMIDLVFNAISVLQNYFVAQLEPFFDQYVAFWFGLIGL
jgi:hypothetical protein